MQPRRSALYMPGANPRAMEKAKKLDSALQKSGDLFYRKKSWVENIEMLLVAAIVVIGIRSF